MSHCVQTTIVAVLHLEDGSAFVAEELWFDASFLGRFLNLWSLSAESSTGHQNPHYLQAMLVRASAKYCFLPLQLLPPLHDIREDHSI
jgi:hypothetical protein